MDFLYIMHNNDPVNMEKNSELGGVRLQFKISNSREIPGPKKRELGGSTIYLFSIQTTL